MSISFLKGDCLDVMKCLPDKYIDCFIVDLPYGCLGPKKAGTDGAFSGCPWDVKIDLVAFWKEVKRLRKNDTVPTIMFCNTLFGYDLIKSNEKEFRYDLVWSKSNAVGFLLANKMPMKSHEMIYVFSKKGAYYKRINIQGDFPNTKRGKGTKPTNVYNAMPTFYPTTSTTERCVKSVIKQEELKVHKRSDTSNVYPKLKDVAWEDNGERCVKSVIELSNKKGKGQHPTQKPYELYEWLLKRYVPEKGTVLDPTAGSFTSCIVAKELGYKAIGIEKDSKFFYKAVSNL